MPFTQENRFLQINTPLGEDVLLLARFDGKEGLSMPFSFELDLASHNHSIVFSDIIGQNVTVSLVLENGEIRYFNGIISCFSQVQRGSGEGEEDTHLSYYTAKMVPWLWLLTKTSDSRIFQELSVPEIVEKIFVEKGFLDYDIRIHSSYEKRNYCVQYRETDFNFISRLLEDEGIFYFFEHENGKHTLILADVPEEHRSCPLQESARYHPVTGGVLEEYVISNLYVTQEIKAGKYTLNDYNFETPNTSLKVEAPSQVELGPGEREIYDHPGGFGKRTDGERLINIRMQEQEAETITINGSSNCCGFVSGYKFTLQEYYRDEMNDQDYVLLSLHHTASQPITVSGGGVSSYVNSFTCIPLSVPFRPPRLSPKPFVEGVQTAIVVGPDGEEIHTDEHGRVKVQFHWDREGKRDQNSSCWIRVSQVWAGAGWGAMFIPRIGHEVVVDFIEGDPDRPIIIGRVYHGINTPPYPLDAQKTKSTIKSDSTIGGGGSNEIRFEDKKGNEEIYLHGQKDWTIMIENDKNQTIGHDETLSVGNNRTKSVGVNQSETIGSNKKIQVGANHTETIGANMSLTVGSNETETVGINKAETVGVAKELTIGAAYQVSVGAAMNETIGAAKAEEIGAAKSVTVGKDSVESVGGSKSVSAGKDIMESAKNNVTIISGKKMLLDIGEQLTIKCGSASVTIKKNGDISFKGKKINVKGSGDIVMKGKKILEN